ncbi:MAG: hypothetical protein MZV63_20920 [Marinilabiliales bacterium]|nr:hypothetical protein [Marinilabiliales bacterium]
MTTSTTCPSRTGSWASLPRFIADNIHVPELQAIITSSFDEFYRQQCAVNILRRSSYPVHFTGSIAYHFRPFLEGTACSGTACKPGYFTLTPMENLVQYHIKNPQCIKS